MEAVLKYHSKERISHYNEILQSFADGLTRAEIMEKHFIADTLIVRMFTRMRAIHGAETNYQLIKILVQKGIIK